VGVDEAAGTYTGALTASGLTSSNYTIGYVDGDYTIVAADHLLVRGTNSSLAYGVAPSFGTGDLTVQYLSSGDTLIHTLAGTDNGNNNFTYDDGAGTTVDFTLAPVGTAFSTGNHLVVGNYSLSGTGVSQTGSNFTGSPVFAGNLAVTQIALTPNATGVSKGYDGSTAMTGVTLGLTGAQTGDAISVNGDGSFSQKNVGTNLGYTISNLALGGADAGNYYLGSGASFSGNDGIITAAALTLSTSDVTKTYDGTTGALGTAVVTGGTLYGSDSISGGSFAFTNKNAGIGNKTVTVGGVTVSDGNGGGNYTVSYADNTTSTINAAALTLSTSDVVKTFDGTTGALGTAVVTGGTLYGSDSLSGGTFAFTDKNAGPGKTVTVGGVTVSDGNSGDNYTVSYADNTTSTINAANLTVSTSNVIKTYDRTTGALGTAVVTGGTLYGSDSISGGSFAFTDKSAGVGNKTVTVGGVTVSDGNGGGNYSVSYADNTTSTINTATLTISGITAIDKTYDGTTVATVDTGGINYGGLIGGDTVAITGSSGAFADKNADTGKTVTLTNTYGGGDLGNYAIVDQTTTTASIGQATLTLSAVTDSKTYDGTTASSGVVTISGLAAGDTLTGATQAFDTKNAGSRTLGVNGYTLTDGNGGANYTVVTNTASGTISQASLTIGGTITANDKVYDGTTAATVDASGATYTGLIGSDDVSILGTFDTRNVGTGKTVTFGYTGTDADNYLISGPTSTTANIGQATLTLGAVTDSKTYDGTTASSGTVAITGLAAGDTLTGASQAFDSKNAGSRTLGVNGYTLTDGNGGANYSVVTNTASGTISQASLTIGGTITANDKVYDGTTAATVDASGATYTGLIGSDDVTVTSGTFDTKNVGTGKAVTLNYTGTDAGNYLISGPTGTTASITQATLTLGAVTDSKTYDGTTASAGVVTVSGLAAGDTLTGASQAFDTKNAGSRTLGVNGYTLTDGNGGANYSVVTNTAAGTISQASLTIGGTITATDKTYDGTTAATVDASGATYTGLLGSDDVSILGTFDTRNVGTGKTVTFGYTGTDASNYLISGPTGTTANIGQATLTLGAVTDSKTYDGTTASSGVVTVSGLAAGDTLTGATQAFDTKNAGSRTLGVNGYTLTDGNGGANYTVVTNTAAGTISQASLTIGGTITADKTYDGTNTATVDASGATYTGLIDGDDVAVGTTGTFADGNAGTDKTVTVSYTGADAGNYVITQPGGVTADIGRADITLSTSDVVKTYDGNTSAAGSALVTSGVLYGSDSLSGGDFAFTNKNAGIGNKTVTVGGVTINDGNGGGNYAVTYANNFTSTINPATLVVTDDGSGGHDVSGVVPGDNVNVTGPSGGLTLGGSDANNYAITDQTNGNSGNGNGNGGYGVGQDGTPLDNFGDDYGTLAGGRGRDMVVEKATMPRNGSEIIEKAVGPRITTLANDQSRGPLIDDPQRWPYPTNREISAAIRFPGK
jgi:hypothetical protein